MGKRKGNDQRTCAAHAVRLRRRGRQHKQPGVEVRAVYVPDRQRQVQALLKLLECLPTGPACGENENGPPAEEADEPNK